MGNLPIRPNVTPINPTKPLCEACPKSPSGRWTPKRPVVVGYRGRMLCPSHAVDAIRADGLTLDQAIGYRR